jgi:threonine aldolase
MEIRWLPALRLNADVTPAIEGAKQMRQSGILAAACLCARNSVERLADDHTNAEHLAEGLARIAPVKALSHATNMVFAQFPETDRAPLEAWLKARGILTQMLYRSRFVTNRDASREDVDTFVAAVGAYFAQLCQ